MGSAKQERDETESKRLRLLRRTARANSTVQVVGVTAGSLTSSDADTGAQLDACHAGAPLRKSDQTISERDPILRQLLQDGLILVDAQSMLRATPAGLQHLKRAMSSGDPFQDQHRVLQETAIKPQRHAPHDAAMRVTVNVAESPLAWFRQRRGRNGAAFIDETQFEAGERLRRDFTRGQMAQSVTASWSMTGGGRQSRKRGGRMSGRGDISDVALDARRRVQQALGALEPEMAALLADVCCELRPMEETEKRRGWPKRSGRVVLGIALTALARHYGLISDASHGRARTAHWGAADYRPQI